MKITWLRYLDFWFGHNGCKRWFACFVPKKPCPDINVIKATQDDIMDDVISIVDRGTTGAHDGIGTGFSFPRNLAMKERKGSSRSCLSGRSSVRSTQVATGISVRSDGVLL